MTPTIPYDTDLAYIHDMGYGDFAREAAPGLLQILSRDDTESRLVVDLGCGSGIWAQCLLEAGFEVLGFDVSAAMVEIARRRAPRASFQVQSFLEVEIPPCHSVTALGEVFNYLFDAQNSLTTLQTVLRRIFQALVPEGLLIFDVAEPGRCQGQTQSFREGPDWACLVEYVHEEARQRLSRRIVMFRKVGETYRRLEEIHSQQLYPRDEIAGLLRNIGFQVDALPGYGVSTFPPGVAGFLARKSPRRRRIASVGRQG